VALKNHQVDVVEILAATETVREVIAWVHRRAKFAATGTLKAKITITLFRYRTMLAETSDRELHWQVIAYRAKQIFGNHNNLQNGFKGVKKESEIRQIDLVLPVRLQQDAIDNVNIDRPTSGSADRRSRAPITLTTR
jgi:hypothetical protein